jgi:hypothetical protein
MNSTPTANHTVHESLLTDEELAKVSVVKAVGSVLSILGTSFIILVYIYLSLKLRDNKERSNSQNSQASSQKDTNHTEYKRLKMGLGHNLIFLLSMSDFIYGISAFIKMSGFTHKEVDSNIVDSHCVAQGFLINFSEVSSICWTSMIAFMIYLGTFKDITKISKIYFYFFLYSYGLPLVLSIGPLITESYGPAGAWCWMNTQNLGNHAAWVWALIIYIFTWVNIIFNIYAVVKTINYFEIRAFETREEGNKKEYNFLKNFCIVLKFFPMILIVCWIFPTINRIYTFFSHHQNIYLYSLHIFFSSSTGFMNSLVYSYYYRNLIPCLSCFNSGNSDTEDVSNSNNDAKNEINIKIENNDDSPNKFVLEKNNSVVNQDYIQNFTEIDINGSFDARHDHESKNTIN